MTVRSVLFDLDNTLTDRRASITQFAHRFRAHFAEQLNDMPFDVLEGVMQQGDNLGYKPKPQMFEEIMNWLPWSQPPELDLIRDFWYAQSPSCMQPRPDMMDVLKTLRDRGYRLGIISNGQTQVQNATIDTIGVRDYMQTIVISEAAGVRKPDAAIFNIALASLAIAAQEALYVGDHPISDMLGARNAGLTCVWMRSGGHVWPDEQPPPAYRIDNLRELIDLLTDQA